MLYKNGGSSKRCLLNDVHTENENNCSKPFPWDFSKYILAFTEKSGFQFSKFQNINIALEPNIPGSKYAAMM